MDWHTYEGIAHVRKRQITVEQDDCYYVKSKQSRCVSPCNASSTFSWADLPDVFLRPIFFNLPGLSRLAANQVCRSWRNVMPFTDMHITLEYGIHFKSIQTLLEFLRCLHITCHRPDQTELSLCKLSFELLYSSSSSSICPHMTICDIFLVNLSKLACGSLISLNTKGFCLDEDARRILLLGFSHLKTLKCTGIPPGGYGKYEVISNDFNMENLLWTADFAQHFPYLEVLECRFLAPDGSLPLTLRELRLVLPPNLVDGYVMSLEDLLTESPLLETLHLENILLIQEQQWIAQDDSLGAPVSTVLPQMSRLKHIVYKNQNCNLRRCDIEPLLGSAQNLVTLAIKFHSLDRNPEHFLSLSSTSIYLPRLRKLTFTLTDDEQLYHHAYAAVLHRFAPSSDLRVLKLRLKTFESMDKVDLAKLTGQLFPNLNHLTWVAEYERGTSLDILDSNPILALWHQCRLLEEVVFKNFKLQDHGYIAIGRTPNHIRTIRFYSFCNAEIFYDHLLRQVQLRYRGRERRPNSVTIVCRGACHCEHREEFKRYGFIFEEW